MRDYSNFDRYLERLYQDIYDQPEDPGHISWTKDAIQKLFPKGVESVLDVGCGTGFCQDLLPSNISYTGITASEKDRADAKKKNRNVRLGDMTYLPFDNNSFDLILARHVLEHSPFPIITLMEWHRVSSKYLVLVAPSPEHWNVHGKNHLSMMYRPQLWQCFEQSGWSIITTHDMVSTDMPFVLEYSNNKHLLSKNKELIPHPGPPVSIEYRYLCEKKI